MKLNDLIFIEHTNKKASRFRKAFAPPAGLEPATL